MDAAERKHFTAAHLTLETLINTYPIPNMPMKREWLCETRESPVAATVGLLLPTAKSRNLRGQIECNRSVNVN
jgi:hypothetical protein